MNKSSKQDWNDVIIINVGGVRHETMRSTLNNLPGTRLADIARMRRHFRPSRNDYFFDRSPALFEYILNYYRVGELHLPPGACSEMVLREFEYWGIEKTLLRGCCWLKFNAQCVAYKTLQDFAQGHTVAYDPRELSSKSCYKRWRPRIWNFLDDPYSSMPAKVLGIVSIGFVVLSIFTFAAETHPYFKGEPFDDTDTCAQPVLICTLSGSTGIVTPAPPSTVTHMYSENSTHDHNISTTTPFVTSSDAANETRSAIESFLLDWMDYPNVSLGVIDLICYSFFTCEVVLRLIFCPNFRRFFHSGFNIVDVLSVVLFYIEITINVFQRSVSEQRSLLEALFILRLLRIFRVFRLVRHHRGLQVLVYTLRASVREIFLLVVFLAIGVLLFGSLIFYADNDNAKIKSIPHGLWWAIVTMTTVGYGDVVPCNTWGKIVGASCAICGLLMIAFTAPVIVNNFMLFYHQVQFGKKPDLPKAHNSARPSIVWPFNNHESDVVDEEEAETDDSKLGACAATTYPETDISTVSVQQHCDGIHNPGHQCDGLLKSPSTSSSLHQAQCDGLLKSGAPDSPPNQQMEGLLKSGNQLGASVPHSSEGLLKSDKPGAKQKESEIAMEATTSAPNSPPPVTPPPNYYSMTFQTYI